MKGNPVCREGRLRSKPTWLNASGVNHAGFFYGPTRTAVIPPEMKCDDAVHRNNGSTNRRSRNGVPAATDRHVPKSVSVVLSGETLVVTLHGALSPAEQAMAQSPEGAAKEQEF